MQTKVHDYGDVTIVEMTGTLDIETQFRFRQACLRHLNGKKVVFNLENLNFVGSNGITPFVETIRFLAKSSRDGIKMCGLRSEFKRIFMSNQIQSLEIFEDQQSAVQSFYLKPSIPQEFEE